MTEREMDALIRRWLAAREPSETPASMRDAVASVPYVEPRSWRPSLAPALSIAIGAAAVAVAALLGYQFLGCAHRWAWATAGESSAAFGSGGQRTGRLRIGRRHLRR